MSWDALYADVAPPEENPTWGDYGQTIKSGGGSALAGTASGLKYLYELGGGEAGNVAKLLDSLQGAGNAISDDALADMTESGRRRFAAGVTTPEFWEHPISSLALKATGQIPNVAAMATPMGLFNDARMAVAAVSTVGGILSSGELLNGFYQKVAEASDETLQKQSPLYREMRERGTEEREARQTYTQTMLGLKPAYAFLFGAADGVLGPVGNVVRGVKGGVRHGVAKAARGAAAGEFVEEGGGAVMGQQAEIEGGLREKFDPREALDQALTGAVLGGVLGGASGIGGGKGKAKADEIKAKRQQGAGEEDAAVEATAQGAQVGAAEPVGPAAATITPKSAKGVTVLPDPISPNQAEAEAITDLQQPKPPAAAPAPPAAAPAPPPTQPVPPPVPPAPAAQEAVQPQQTPPSPLPLGGALAAAPPSQVAPPAAAAPVTPQVTPSPAAMNAQAAMMPAEALQQPAPVTGAGVSAQAAPAAPITEAAPRAPRVLPSLTAESKLNEVAQQVAQEETAKEAAQTIKDADKEPGAKKLSKEEKATIETRAKKAEAVFEKHHVELTVPESPAARREMAAKLQTILNDAAEQGLVLRETLPERVRKQSKGLTEEERTQYHSSIPEKVGHGAMSPHVRYLREIVGIQKALLGTKFGPKSKERARVAQFVTEHNKKALDLMGVRRKEEGAALKEQYQGTVEDAERRQAAGGMKSVDAAGKGVNVSPQSAGPASEGRVLGANEKAVIAAEALARLQQKEADKAAAEGKQVAAPPAPPPAEVKTEAKPKLSRVEQAKAAAARLADKYAPTSVVKSETEVSGAAPVEISVSEAKTPTETKEEKPTEIVVAEKPQEEKVAEKPAEIPPVAEAPQGQLIGKEAPSTEVTPEVTPERVRLPPTKIEEGTHEGMVPVLRKRNALRKWVNELSDEDYAKVNPDTHRVLVDASSMRTLAMVETDLAQQVGRAPEKPVSTGTIERTPQQRILDAKEAKEAAAEAEALAARAAASAARAAKKPAITPEQRAAAIAALKTGKVRLHDEVYAEDMNLDEVTDEEVAEILAKLSAINQANETKEVNALGLTPKQQEFQNLLEKQLAYMQQTFNSPNLHFGDLWANKLEAAAEVYNHPEGIVVQTTAREILQNLNLDHLGKLPKYMQDFIRGRLFEVLPDTKVYVVDSDLMSDSLSRDRGKAPFGYFSGSRTGGGYIAIRSDLLHVGNQAKFAHTAIHEAMHAALDHKLDTDPVFRDRVELLREELRRQTEGSPTAAAIADYAVNIEANEFVTELGSNAELQELMSRLTISPKLAQQLELPGGPAKKWTMWGAFLEKVRKAIGFKPTPGVHNFLDEALKVIAPELETVRGQRVHDNSFEQYKGPRAFDMAAARHGVATRAAAAGINTGGKLARAKDKISTLWMMARRNTHLFGPSNMLNRLFEARAFMDRAKTDILNKYGGNEASLAIAKAEREHPEAMARAKQTLFDASLHDVNLDGSNDHLGKDKLMGVQAKNEIARLQREWNNPALDPVRETLRGAIKFFRDIHNAVSRETIKNVLAEANIHDNALVDRIHNGGITEADKAWMDNKVVAALNEVQSLKRRHGSYVPFRRYGNFVSAAEHELSVPSNATKINDNTLQFVDPTGKGGNARARAAVKGYLRSNSHTPQGNKLTPGQINKVWVDKADPSKIIPAEDVNAIPAYRVAMQTQHVEFHETQAEAQRSAADLQQSGLTNARNHAREDAYKNERNIQGAMGTILRSLEKQQRYIDADATQKLAMREMFHDLTLGLSGTTSIKSSMKQRRNVAGMSHDLGRVTSDYARMTANHLARLQHRPKIDSIFAEMRAYMKDHQYDNDAIRRDEIYKEFINRVYGRAAGTAEEHKTGAVTRLLQLSRLSRLAGPSFHIINAHEPWTTSLPMIGGRHKFGATAKALVDAYNFIGGRAGVTAGLRDTAKAYTNDGGFTDYVKMFKDTIGASRIAGPDKISRMQDMIDYMDARNLYANSAIFEVGKFANPQGNLAGRALDRADLMANQVGSAIEAINRTVTGLTAYNLEYKKNGGNHEAAMHYAYSTAHETMGDYSHWNAAPVFNTGAGRVALQFKKFGHKTYYLLGNTMGNALRGDREAMKQLAGVLVTHGLVAGALGMPTEPLKVALMAANMVGATGFTPDDYEYAVRQLAARLAGQKGGEIISKGLYRGIGIEVSGRMGLDTLLTHGAPKGQKANDIKAFLFDTLAGAPAGYLLDQVAAAQALAKGDVATFVEKASPLRTVGDIAKAYTGATGPKTGPSGKTTQEQFNAWETTVRAVGFTPSSVAEHGAMRGTVARESKRLSADRSELINTWIDASGAKKVEAQRAVQEFNSGRPKTEQISQKDLSAAARRRETEKPKTYHGITVSKRTKEIYERAEGVFNP